MGGVLVPLSIHSYLPFSVKAQTQRRRAARIQDSRKSRFMKITQLTSCVVSCGLVDRFSCYYSERSTK